MPSSEPAEEADPDARAGVGLLVWVAVAFVLFSLVSGKRSGYLLPYVPPLALLIACGVTRVRPDERLERALVAWPLAAVPACVGLCAGAAALLAFAVPLAWGLELPPSRATDFVGRLPGGTPLVLALAALALLALVALARRAQDLPERAAALAGAAAVVLGAVHGVALSAANRDRAIRPFGEALARIVPEGAPLLLLDELHDGRINLYTGAEHHDVILGEELPARLAAPDRVWLVARERDWGALPADVREGLEVAIDYAYSGGRRRFLLLRER